MPAVVKRTVGSFSGISDFPEISAWPFPLKKSMYMRLSSLPVMPPKVRGGKGDVNGSRENGRKVVRATSMKRQNGLVIASYATIYIVWGSTYFFIRQSVLTIPPMWVLAIRWLIGGGLLLGFSAARGGLRQLPSPRNILASIVLGMLLILFGNGGITVAELKVDSYVAALLASSTPIIVALFDSLLLRKRLAATRVLGVVFGFAGVAVLLYNGHSIAASLNASVLIGLGGVLCWGLA